MLLVPFGKWFAKPSEHFSHEVATVNEEFLSILAKPRQLLHQPGDLTGSPPPRSARINRRRATRAGRRDGLAINMIRAVARDEDAGNVRHRSLLRNHETIFIQRDFALEQIGVRHMADGDEDAGDGQNLFFAVLRFFNFTPVTLSASRRESP